MGKEKLRVGDESGFHICRGVIKVLRGMVGDKVNSDDNNSDNDDKFDNDTDTPPPPHTPLIPLSSYWTMRQEIRSWRIPYLLSRTRTYPL